MPLSKAAFVVVAILLAAAAVGGIVAVAVRPAAKPRPQAAVQPQQPATVPLQVQPNCNGCNLPPITEVCIPKGLSYDCQQCWIAKLNAANLIPNQIIPVAIGSGGPGTGWGYWALSGTNMEFPGMPAKAKGSAYGYSIVHVYYCR